MLLVILIIFVFGLIIGSFLNVCIYRYQSQESIAKGRSHCQNCDHSLSWYELIPVFSWIFLGGKCKSCKQPISIRYPLVECLTGFIFVSVFLTFGFTLDTLVYFLFVSILIMAGFIDYDSMIIPDRTHIICILCGILLLILHPDQLTNKLIGLVVVSVPLFLIAYFTKGMGYGDVKLMASCGFVLGWQNILFAFLLGSVIASIYGIITSRINKTSLKSEIPFGPHLVISILFCLFFGNPLITWYLTSFF